MGLILTSTAGLSLWIVLWSFGVSGFDAILLTAVMILTAIALRTVAGSLLGRRE